MKKLLEWAAIGVVGIAVSLATPVASRADGENNADPSDYPILRAIRARRSGGFYDEG